MQSSKHVLLRLSEQATVPFFLQAHVSMFVRLQAASPPMNSTILLIAVLSHVTDYQTRVSALQEPKLPGSLTMLKAGGGGVIYGI